MKSTFLEKYARETALRKEVKIGEAFVYEGDSYNIQIASATSLEGSGIWNYDISLETGLLVSARDNETVLLVEAEIEWEWK